MTRMDSNGWYEVLRRFSESSLLVFYCEIRDESSLGGTLLRCRKSLVGQEVKCMQLHQHYHNVIRTLSLSIRPAGEAQPAKHRFR